MQKNVIAVLIGALTFVIGMMIYDSIKEYRARQLAARAVAAAATK